MNETSTANHRVIEPGTAPSSTATNLFTPARQMSISPWWTNHPPIAAAPDSHTEAFDNAIEDYLTEPRTVKDTAYAIGQPTYLTRRRLDYLIAVGRVSRLGYRAFVRADYAVPISVTTAILEFLCEPKSSPDIALHTGRSGSVTRHDLRYLIESGSVIRVGSDVYACASYAGRPNQQRPDPAAKHLPQKAFTPVEDCRGNPRPAQRASPGLTRACQRDLIVTAILDCLIEPRSVSDIAAQINRSEGATRKRLRIMRSRGRVMRIGYCAYVRVDHLALVTGQHFPSVRRERPQPIRDSILAFLSEPRSARAIADHIDRSVPVATGHLAAMRRRGLAIRIGFSAYAQADYTGPDTSFGRSPSVSDSLATP